ncbi:hypothetical protein BDZ97DRAFT_1760084 [Flammula alnicola]|nr:hypothetical protein BDZ97DRAFT_1760084 [Flammula alnicola]
MAGCDTCVTMILEEDTNVDLPIRSGSLAMRRLSSSVFTNLLFTMNILTSGNDEDLVALKAAWKYYDPLITQFLSYERGLLGLDGDFTQSHEMRELLKIELKQSTPGNPNVLAFLRNGYENLHNWPQQLLKFQGFLDEVLTQDYRHMGGTGSWRLLQFLCANRSSMAQGKIVSNLTVVATHLAYIRETRFHASTFSDLPDQINEDIIQRASSGEEKLFLTELADFIQPLTTMHNRTASGGVSLTSFRAPFQLAVEISPLYLLSLILLARKSWSRSSLLRTAFCLGNDKPEALLEVEKVLWTMIFSMADGSLNPKDALERLKSDLPWDLIWSVAESKQQSSWFHLTKSSQTSVSNAAVGGSFFHTTDHESIQSHPATNLSRVKDGRGGTANDSNMDIDNVDSMDSMTPDGSAAASTGATPELDSSAFGDMSDQAVATRKSRGNVNSNSLQANVQNSIGMQQEKDLLPDRMLEDDSLSLGDLRHLQLFSDPEQAGGLQNSTSLDQDAGPTNGMTVNPAAIEGRHSLLHPLDKDGETDKDSSSDKMAVEDPSSHHWKALGLSGSEDEGEEDWEEGEEEEDQEEGEEEDQDEGEEEEQVEDDEGRRKYEQMDIEGEDDSEEENEEEDDDASSQMDVDQPASTRQSAHIKRLQKSASMKPNWLSSSPRMKGKKRPSSAMTPKPAPPKKSSPSTPNALSHPPPPLLSKSIKKVNNVSDPATSGSKLNPIDVDDLFNLMSSWEPDNLDTFQPVKEEREENVGLPKRVLERHKCPRDYTVFGPTGEKVVLEPEFHFPDYVKRFDEIMSGIKKSYINEKPMHIVHPSSSVITVLTYQEYLDMPQDELHSVLAEKNIIVRRAPVPDHEFDAKGLDFVHLLHSPMSLQDYSLQGHVDELLDKEEEDAIRSVQSSRHTVTFFHVDPDGFNTRALLVRGGKLWIFYREVRDMPLSSRHVFFDKGFHLDRFTDKAKYDLEAVFLSKGDFLLRLLEKKLVQTDAGHHLPDVQTFPSLVNLLSLYNLIILGNVLDRTVHLLKQVEQPAVNHDVIGKLLMSSKTAYVTAI